MIKRMTIMLIVAFVFSIAIPVSPTTLCSDCNVYSCICSHDVSYYNNAESSQFNEVVVTERYFTTGTENVNASSVIVRPDPRARHYTGTTLRVRPYESEDKNSFADGPSLRLSYDVHLLEGAKHVANRVTIKYGNSTLKQWLGPEVETTGEHGIGTYGIPPGIGSYRVEIIDEREVRFYLGNYPLYTFNYSKEDAPYGVGIESIREGIPDLKSYARFYSEAVYSEPEYTYNDPLIRGLPLNIKIITEKCNTPCSITINDKTVSGESVHIGPLSSNICKLAIEDTTAFDAGKHDLIIEIGNFIYEEEIIILSEDNYSLFDNIDKLIIAAEDTLKKKSKYPAYALSDAIFGLVPGLSQITTAKNAIDTVNVALDLLGVEWDKYENKVKKDGVYIEDSNMPTNLKLEQARYTFKGHKTTRDWLEDYLADFVYNNSIRGFLSKIGITNRHSYYENIIENMSPSAEEIQRINNLIRIGCKYISETEQDRIYTSDYLGNPTLPYLSTHQRGNNTLPSLSGLLSKDGISAFGQNLILLLDIFTEDLSWIEPTPDKNNIYQEISSNTMEPMAITVASVTATLVALYKIMSTIDTGANLLYYTGLCHGKGLLAETIDYKHKKVFSAILDDDVPKTFMSEITGDSINKNFQESSLIEDLSLKINNKEHYEVGDIASPELVVTNDSNEKYENLFYWFLTPQGNYLYADQFSIEPNSVKKINLEYEVKNEKFHVNEAWITDKNIKTITDTDSTFSVGESNNIGVKMSVENNRTYKPGEIELSIVVENVGKEDILDGALLLNEEIFNIGDLRSGERIIYPISLTHNEFGYYYYILEMYDGDKERLASESVIFEVEEFDTLHAINKMENFVFEPNDKISISAEIRNSLWEEVLMDYSVKVTTPSGNIITDTTFKATEEGTYNVKIVPEPDKDGYICYSDEFNMVVGSPSNLALNMVIVDNKWLELKVTNDIGEPINNTEISIAEDIWYTNERGEAIISLNSINDIYVNASKFPYNPDIKELLIFGDVTGDFKISVADAIQILRHIVGLNDLRKNVEVPNAYQRAKVSGDDEIGVNDAILILRSIVGLTDSFPVE